MLPNQLRIHDVQLISHLENAAQGLNQYQEQEPPPSVIVEGEDEYEVEHRDNSRPVRRQLYYLLKWRGYNERSREPAANLDRLKAINDFHTEQPGKPGS
jgi:hypothetical protein